MVTRSSALSLVATGILAAMALTACSQASAVTPSPAADAQRVDGGIIEYGHQQEPACVFGGWIEQAYLSSNVLDALVSLDENHRVVPWLAQSWETSADGLTWTFHLVEGVNFTDGSPLTAEAVAYNFDYWLAGGNSTAKVWLEGYYDRAEAVDEHTVAIHLSSPYPRLDENLTQGYFGIQSQKSLTERTEEENCAAPVGTGAFTVGEWKRGESIQLIRNENYSTAPANAKHRGPAYVEGIDWKFISDATTRVASLRAGETDLIYDVPGIEWAGVESSGYELQKYVTPGRPQQLTFNTVSGPFVDENVRKAFAFSLDRSAIVETIGKGVIPVEGNGAVSQTTPGYSEKAANTYDYDPKRAAELLDAAGWSETNEDGYRVKDGTVLTVQLPYGAGSIINAEGAAILQGVQEQARATGFKVDLYPLAQSAFFGGERSTPDTRDIAAGYWTAVTAGIQWINWRSNTEAAPNHNNPSFAVNTELDALIQKANGTADVDAQNALYAQAQEYIADHALSIGLYDRLSTLAVSPFLRDVWQENAQGGPVFSDAYFVE